MQLSLTEDQAMLAKTVGGFMTGHEPVARLRKLRDQHDERGYSQALYKEMGDLGWLAIPFKEADGGAGMGLAEAILISESMGRTLAPEPFVSSILLAGHVLAAAGNEAQRSQWLQPAIEGSKVLALAYQENGSRYDQNRVMTRAERNAKGFRLSGQKIQVLGGFSADAFVVSARTSGADSDRKGISLFLVPASTAGLRASRQWRLDSRNAALLDLEGMQLDATALLGQVDEGAGVLAEAIDRATIGLCAEMLGGMNEAFNRTLSYLKERKQFGAVIGTFQALKHRAAKMFIEVELARSATMAAARAIDEGGIEALGLISVAKARCSDAYVLIANEAVQIHAGIGMTDEHEIGFFMKHARTCELTFGDAAFHRDRFARLSGF